MSDICAKHDIDHDDYVKLLSSLKDGFEEWDVERAVDFNSDFATAKSKSEFDEQLEKNFNKFLKRFGKEGFVMVDLLHVLINSRKVRTMDKEYMSGFISSGITFDDEGNMIIYNER